MTADYDDFLAEDRRAAVLGFLDRADGAANERVIHTALRESLFPRLTRAQLRAELDFLRQVGCVTHEWLHDEVLVASLTARGQDTARGDVSFEGIARPDRIR